MLAFQVLYAREANPGKTLSDEDLFLQSELALAGKEPKDESSSAVNTAEDAEGQSYPRFYPGEQKRLRQFATELLEAVYLHQDEIDSRICSVAKNWILSRMALTDRNILRLATAELLYFPTETPIVVNEAVELAKRFGTERSGSFVNGVLGAIGKSSKMDS